MLPEEQFISLITMDLRDQIKSLLSNDEFIKGIIERSTPPLQTTLSDWTLDDGVKIILRLTWVTFTVGTRWSALGVGCRAWRREEKAEVGHQR